MECKEDIVPLKDLNPEFAFEKMCDELHQYVEARDNGCCVLCGNLGGEHHHVTYRSHLGKHKANNLATLCNKCHYKIHNISDKLKELIFSRIKENEKLFRERLI